MPTARRAGNVDVERSQPRRAHGLDILGHGQVDRPGTLGLRQLERLADHLRHRTRGQDHIRPLGHRREHRHQVDALVGLLVDPVQANLRRQRHHRRAVRGGIGRAQQQVDRPRTQRGRDHPRAPGDPAVHLGHERRRLLMTDEHIPDGRADQRVTKRMFSSPGMPIRPRRPPAPGSSPADPRRQAVPRPPTRTYRPRTRYGQARAAAWTGTPPMAAAHIARAAR